MTLANVTDECAAQRFTTIALEQAIRNIRLELDTLPPFHQGRAEKLAEIDQLDDMIARRR